MKESSYDNGIFNLRYNVSTGGFSSISLVGDEQKMNFVRSKIGFGVPKGRHSPSGLAIKDGVMSVTFQYYNYLDCIVTFTPTSEGITGNYVFKNVGKQTLTCAKRELGVYVTFSTPDDIPLVSIKRRVISHVFCGLDTAYVYNERLYSNKKSLSLVVTKGRIIDSSKENAYRAGSFGEVALCLDELTLAPEESYELEWTIFCTESISDFLEKCKSLNKPIAFSKQGYVLERDKQYSCTLTEGDVISFDDVNYQQQGNSVLFSSEGIGQRTLVFSKENNISQANFYFCENVTKTAQTAIKYYDTTCLSEGLYMPYSTNQNSVKRIPLSVAESAPCGLLLLIAYLNVCDIEEKANIESRIAKGITSLNSKLFVYENGVIAKINADKRLYPLYIELLFEYAKLSGKQAYANGGYGIMQEHFMADNAYYLNLLLKQVQSKQPLAESVKQKLIACAKRYLADEYSYPKLKPKYSEVAETVKCLTLVAYYLLTEDEQAKGALEGCYHRLCCYLGVSSDYKAYALPIRAGDGFGFKGSVANCMPSKYSVFAYFALNALGELIPEAGNRAQGLLYATLSLLCVPCCQCYNLPLEIEGKLSATIEDGVSNGEQYLLYLLLKTVS